MDISARAVLLSDRPRMGHLGHQGSHAPVRPILHRRLILSQTEAATSGEIRQDFYSNRHPAPTYFSASSFPQTDTHLGIVHRESGMGRGLLVAAFDFSTAHADEFHDWYDLEHIPERMAVAGFGACERWIGPRRLRFVRRARRRGRTGSPTGTYSSGGKHFQRHG
jgi:hypothetical protein